MEQNIYNSKAIIKNMPSAFAYHKVIFDENKKPVNYVFLDVNKKFTELTGLKKENVINKKATEVLSDITEGSFDWIQFYGQLSLTGGSKTLEEYSKPLGRWYEVQAYSQREGYFSTIFHDITKRKEKEQKLQKMSERLNNIFNNIDDIVWAISWPDLEVKFVSKAIEDIIGYTIQDFKEDPSFLQKITHPEDKEINKKSIKDLKEKGYTKREFRVICKDGSIKWIQDRGKMIYNQKNEPVKVEGVMRDITERVKERKEFEMMNFTVDKSDLIIFRLSPEGIIDYVNEKVSDKLGYKKEEIIGETPKLFVEADNYIDRKKIWNKIKKNNSITYKRKFVTKSGNEFPVEITSQYFKYQDREYEFAFAKDITERKKAKEKMKTNKEKYETIFRSSPLGIVLEDKNGNIIEANKMMTKMSGYTKEELEGSNVFDKFVLEANKEEARENIKEIIKNDREIQFDTKTRIKNGEIRRYQLNETSIILPNGKKGLISMQLDITERKKQEEKIKYLSYRDQLTDLYNRRFFNEEINRLDTKRQLPLSIIMADVNGLKIINDSYGHQKGDELLIKTAEILKSSLRDEDVLVRHGGDEFAILLPQTTQKEAQKIIERIKEKTEITKQNPISISIGIGVATKRKEEEDIEDILKKADNAMYKNKLSNSKSTKNKIIQNLLNTLETKSSETKDHALRMQKLAHELGKEIDLSNSELNRLSLLATLHDIGKTTISKNILNKAGDLTEVEWEIIKEHPETGYKIAAASDDFALVAEEILAHHEHWNGSGYPRGLAAEDIPFLARIISIVDAYDVMTNDRSYSKAIAKEKALAEIKKCAGSQFDPELAKVFIELMQEK